MGVTAASMVVPMAVMMMAKRCHADEVYRQAKTAHNKQLS